MMTSLPKNGLINAIKWRDVSMDQFHFMITTTIFGQMFKFLLMMKPNKNSKLKF